MSEWRWRSGALGIGVLIGYLLVPHPPARVETRTVTQEVIKWKVATHIVTLPGATVYLDGKGGTTITGPVDLNSLSEGSASRTTDSQTKIESAAWTSAISVGVLLPRPALQVGCDWHIGDLFGRRVGIGAGVLAEFPWGAYVPDRGGARVMLTF